MPLFKGMEIAKELRALRCFFGPPMRQPIEIRFSPNSFYKFIRTMAQVYNYDISFTLTVAVVAKMATKIG